MIFCFDTNEDPDIMQVGGKAKSLIEMTKVGMNVPAGFVLPVDFFAVWLDRILKSTEWTTYLKEPTPEHSEMLVRTCRGYDFTPSQRHRIDDQIDKIPVYQSFAVRSSSPDEDLEGISFAGMYKSHLGVSRNGLERAIAYVFASLFEQGVMEYKRQHGYAIDHLSMAVIVQVQLASEVSGVGFSINPQNNCYDEAVINASFGLGEAIVSGRVTPDMYGFEKVEKRIISKSIGTKESEFILDASAGIREVTCEHSQEQALTDAQIMEVAHLIVTCESHYEKPVDIEWAYVEETLYLLQVRPITTYFPLFDQLMTKPGERKKFYVDIIACSQGFNDQLSVLGLDIWGLVMDNIGGQNIMPSGEGGYVINVCGKQYFDVSNILKGMGNSLAMATVGNHEQAVKDHKELIIAEYKSLSSTKAMWVSKKAMMKVAFKMIPIMLKMLSNPRKQGRIYSELSDHVIHEIRKMTNNRPFDQLVEEGFKLLGLIASNTVAYVPGQLSISRINKLFRNRGLEDEIAAICTDLVSNPTALMGKSLYELACQNEIKESNSEEVFIKHLHEGSFSEEFVKGYERHMKLFGDRGFKEIDIATPRIKHLPGVFFRQLKCINTEDNQLKRAVQRKAQAMEVLKSEAVKMNKLKKFEKNMEIYSHLFGFRETPKYLVVVLIGHLHDLVLEIGNGLVKEKRLDVAEQVFDLHLHDIVKAQTDKTFDVLATAKSNTSCYEKVKHIKEWPSNIDSRGKILPPIVKGDKDLLIGQAISSGIVRGKAKVLNSPYEKQVNPGDILVTKSTEPAWTPIFINASGIALEVGGLLQHGAIIAREYGIPCVSGLWQVTDKIRDGDIIEVDGTKGTVKVIESSR